MKNLLFIGLVCCSFVAKAQPNLILNGSFELNNITQCIEELDHKTDYDSKILYSTHFGNSFTTYIVNDSCLICSPPVYWGGGAQEGSYFLSIHSRENTTPVSYIKQGKISFDLISPLLGNKNYKLSFFIKKPPIFPTTTTPCAEVKNNYISVGISNTDDVFGTHLITSPYGDTIWQQYSIVFNTQNAEEYITVKVGVNGTIDYNVFIDNFVLVETEEPLTTGVNEVPKVEKQLLKIVDILGKESSPNKKGLLFYIYSDGTVEKRIVIE
jgi:hypothetical protein